MGIHDLRYCTATSGDSDNIFPPKYFEYLGYDFLRRENRHEVVCQAPLFCNYNLDERPFFLRVTGILRAFFMMGILIPQDINTMSVFSSSLHLLQNCDFFVHPAYQMEDIICTLRRMMAVHKRVRIKLIPYPVISGPTCGVTNKQKLNRVGSTS
ncbi:hypothetical protein RvY_10717 [Ramazzottius varieornatus]|uniref:Uncharacterized protein n=1 Tax=Ramazzottius varieornatus TaxID=947166 RepID=A0A1D1VG46_RAMVA|nr:hypothetical protein RvY_10717 [Ramazzottius varieornatus]